MGLSKSATLYFENINKNHFVFNKTVFDEKLCDIINSAFSNDKYYYLNIECVCESEYQEKLVEKNYIIIRSNCYDFNKVFEELRKKRIILFENNTIEFLMLSEIESVKFDMMKFGDTTDINIKIGCNPNKSFDDYYDLLRLMFEDVIYRIEQLDLIKKMEIILSYFPNEFLTKEVQYYNFSDAPDSIQKIKFGELDRIDLEKISITELEFLLFNLKKFKIYTLKELYFDLINTLTPRESIVLDKRFNHTLEEIGNELGITRERVRQIVDKAKRRLLRRKEHLDLLEKYLKLYSKYSTFVLKEEIEKNDLHFNMLESFFGLNYDFLSSDIYWWNDPLNQTLIDFVTELPPVIDGNILENKIHEFAEATHLDIHCVQTVVNKVFHRIGTFWASGRITNRQLVFIVLSKYFPEGIYIYSNESIDKIREKVREDFDVELNENDRAVQAIIQNIAMPCGRGTWKTTDNSFEIDNELYNSIEKYIINYSSGVIPISAIFDKFKQDLFDYSIDNKYVLQGYLKRIFSFKYGFTRDYIVREQGDSIIKSVSEFIKNSEMLVTFDDLSAAFPGLSITMMQNIMNNSSIINMNGYYTDIDSLQISIEDKNQIKNLVDSLLIDDKPYSFRKIYDLSKKRLSGFINHYGINHYLQLYSVFNKMFKDDYSFLRPFVAKKGIVIESGEMQIVNMVVYNKECKISDLKDYANSVGVTIDKLIDFITKYSDYIVFKNRFEIIEIKYAGLDSCDFSKIDEIICSFLKDNMYKPLYEFVEYWQLPKVSIKWNNWLLYSIINKYSLRYKAIVSSYNIDDAVPIVVVNSFNEKLIDYSEIHNFDYEDTDINDLLDIEDLE